MMCDNNPVNPFIYLKIANYMFMSSRHIGECDFSVSTYIIKKWSSNFSPALRRPPH
jgi:hypothetical protein